MKNSARVAEEYFASNTASQEDLLPDLDEAAKAIEKLRRPTTFETKLTLSLKGRNGRSGTVNIPILEHDKLRGEYIVELCRFALESKDILTAIEGIAGEQSYKIGKSLLSVLEHGEQ
jgi:hypothetical protein